MGRVVFRNRNMRFLCLSRVAERGGMSWSYDQSGLVEDTFVQIGYPLLIHASEQTFDNYLVDTLDHRSEWKRRQIVVRSKFEGRFEGIHGPGLRHIGGALFPVDLESTRRLDT
jgi:hypothetical protein